MKRTKRLLCLMLALTMLLLSACGGSGGEDGGTGGGEGGAKDTVIVELNMDPPVLVAGFQANTTVSFVSRQMFDTLIYENGDGTFSPGLASSWEYDENGKDIIFTIRDDINFHNGEKMTVDDVVFSFNEIINGTYADTATNMMTGVEKLDDNRMIIHFEAPYGPALDFISTDYMVTFPKAEYEKDPDAFLRNPIGTGPYKFVSWTSGDSITMVRNDDYYGGAPAIENLIFRIFIDSSVAAIALESGEIDVLTNPAQADRNTLMNKTGITYDETESAMVTWCFFNCGPESRFNDFRLREAFSYAIDRDAVMIGAMEGAAVENHTSFPSFLPLSDSNFRATHRYDLAKAQEIMQELGYGPDNRMQLTIGARESDHYYKPLEVIQSQLSEIYVDVTLDRMEAGAWSENVLRSGNFEFNLIATTNGVLDMDERYALYYSTGTQNFYQINSAALDDALDRNRFSTDVEDRRQAQHDIARVLDEEVLVIPVYGNMRAIAYNENLKGVYPEPRYNYRVSEWYW